MKLLLAATFTGGAFTAPALGNVVYNLPLLLAFDVLAQVLRALRDQGEFASKRIDHLGPLVDAARAALPWVDWQTIRNGIDLRNEVAHDGSLHGATVCLDHIAAVETQLVAWAILDAP